MLPISGQQKCCRLKIELQIGPYSEAKKSCYKTLQQFIRQRPWSLTDDQRDGNHFLCTAWHESLYVCLPCQDSKAYKLEQ